MCGCVVLYTGVIGQKSTHLFVSAITHMMWFCSIKMLKCLPMLVWCEMKQNTCEEGKNDTQLIWNPENILFFVKIYEWKHQGCQATCDESDAGHSLLAHV